MYIYIYWWRYGYTYTPHHLYSAYTQLFALLYRYTNLRLNLCAYSDTQSTILCCWKFISFSVQVSTVSPYNAYVHNTIIKWSLCFHVFQCERQVFLLCKNGDARSESFNNRCYESMDPFTMGIFMVFLTRSRWDAKNGKFFFTNLMEIETTKTECMRNLKLSPNEGSNLGSAFWKEIVLPKWDWKLRVIVYKIWYKFLNSLIQLKSKRIK